jgi:hypothetical protein
MIMADWTDPGPRAHPGEGKNPCDGCHECGLRCTAGVQMCQREFESIVAYLGKADRDQVVRILEQEKTIFWFEEIQTEACLFYDVSRRGCLIYPVRPLICRLFGRVEWLPCPIGRSLEQLRGGLELIQAYAREKRATFPEWCTATGIFDWRQLIASRR